MDINDTDKKTETKGRWFELDKKPWWVIVLAAALAAIGGGIGKFVLEEGANKARGYFPTEINIYLFLTDAKSHSGINGAQALLLDTNSNQYLPMADTGSTRVTTHEGRARLIVKVKPGVNYALEVRRKLADGAYRKTIPIAISGDMQEELEFDGSWAFNQGVRPQVLPTSLHVPRPDGNSPSWMQIAYRELGQREAPGTVGNPRIREYFKAIGFNDEDETKVAWSAIFVNWVMQRAGYKGTRDAMGRAWLKWGQSALPPTVGCIAAFWRVNPTSWETHTGFYVGDDGDGMLILGGNQDNAVTIAKLPKSQFLGCRVPGDGV